MSGPLRLVIGDKQLSSWSLRPWLLLRVLDIPCEEEVVRLDRPETARDIAKHSPSGRVPCLIEGEETVWDSLAIIEHIADRRPDAPVWPADPKARSRARAVAAEMHAGFPTLRALWPMHFAYTSLAGPRPAELLAEIARIEAIWTACRGEFGEGGAFLFGAFTAADAMYAPVVSRFRTYGHEPESACVQAYAEAVWALPAMAEWGEGARAEAAAPAES